MRHRKHTFKIGKSGAHRKAMFANMLTSLFTHGRINTTIVKAKELRRWADKMITFAKIGDLNNRRKAIAVVRDIEAVRVLFDEIAPRYKERPGGYTRIVRLHNRRGDGAELCFIELVEEEINFKSKVFSTSKAEKAKASPETVIETESSEEAVEVEVATEKAEGIEEEVEVEKSATVANEEPQKVEEGADNKKKLTE